MSQEEIDTTKGQHKDPGGAQVVVVVIDDGQPPSFALAEALARAKDTVVVAAETAPTWHETAIVSSRYAYELNAYACMALPDVKTHVPFYKGAIKKFRGRRGRYV